MKSLYALRSKWVSKCLTDALLLTIVSFLFTSRRYPLGTGPPPQALSLKTVGTYPVAIIPSRLTQVSWRWRLGWKPSVPKGMIISVAKPGAEIAESAVDALERAFESTLKLGKSRAKDPAPERNTGGHSYSLGRVPGE